jgi:type I restriction enzyme S subunit
VTTARCDGPFGTAIKSEHYKDEGARVIRLQNIRAGRFEGADAAYLNLDYFERELVDHDVIGGDLLIAGLGDENNQVGRACVAPDDLGPALVKADCFRFRLDKKAASSAFIAMMLCTGASADGGFYATGSTRQRIPLSVTGRRRVALPPLSEQTTIATFLDRETAKIDALVADYSSLIELLQEKRQAVISHAVTKGLDPTVPMKDSGVEWLGEVPKHWDVIPLKYLTQFRSGGTLSKDNLDFWNGDVPWASAKDLKSETLHDTSDHITETAIERRAAAYIPHGSVLVVVRGMILARTFPVTIAAVPMAINQDLKALVPFQAITGPYLARCLQASAEESTRRIDEAGHGTKALRMDAWTSIDLPVPRVEEQNVICDVVDTETAKLDILIADAEEAITLLQERRTALISAAVTGKIDVRDLIEQEAA